MRQPSLFAAGASAHVGRDVGRQGGVTLAGSGGACGAVLSSVLGHWADSQTGPGASERAPAEEAQAPDRGLWSAHGEALTSEAIRDVQAAEGELGADADRRDEKDGGDGGDGDAPELTNGGHANQVSKGQRRLYNKHEKMIDQAHLKLGDYKGEAAGFQRLWKNHHARYEAVAKRSGVPAKLIAAIHYRESHGNFHTYLHNGQPLGKPTTITPVGICFDNWEDAAVDALKMKSSVRKGLKMNEKTTDLAAMASFAEQYNGLGYDLHGRVSPYVYAGTDRYQKGKYDSDGHLNPAMRDQQIGVVAMLELISGGKPKAGGEPRPGGTPADTGGVSADGTTSDGGTAPTGGAPVPSADLDGDRGAAAVKASHLLMKKGEKLYHGKSWETEGRNRGPLVDQIMRDNYADPKAGYAWCGMFVGANYAKAGIRKEILRKGAFWSGYRMHLFMTSGGYEGSKRSPWWQAHPHVDLRGKNKHGKKAAIAQFAPQPGDIILFRDNLSHVGMVDNYNADTGVIEAMEGNSGDRVRATAYDQEGSELPIAFLGRFVPSDYEPDGHVDEGVVEAADPVIHHQPADHASTK